MNSRKTLPPTEQALFSIFYAIDSQVKVNIARILTAFRTHKVGTHHFSGVSGYGHDDLGRQTLDRVFATLVAAEAAAVRVQFVSGTHAITCALFGVLSPGDELLAVTGAPYDTLEEVIGVRGDGHGSLRDFGISYRELPLTTEETVDWAGLSTAIRPQTKMVLIQRSCGYSWRPSLTIDEIGRIIRAVKAQNPDTLCFVDNCYGEFVETREPTAVGADLMAGSLIKNPGGTIVTTGGYVAGRSDLEEAATCRLTSPGIGSSGGATFNQNRLLFQGLFLAPQMVGEALKGNYLLASTFSQLGYAVNPAIDASQRDVIQAIRLEDADKQIGRASCRERV